MQGIAKLEEAGFKDAVVKAVKAAAKKRARSSPLESSLTLPFFHPR